LPFIDLFTSIYPNAIEYANAVATAIETALDVAAFVDELDVILSLRVIDELLNEEIVIVFVAVHAEIVILFPGTIDSVSVGDVARTNELFALTVAND
jgi:hypothetical protein